MCVISDMTFEIFVTIGKFERKAVVKSSLELTLELTFYIQQQS